MNEILEKQLKLFQDYWNESQTELLPQSRQERIRDLAAYFEIPEELYSRFAAYAHEFLFPPEGCVQEDGPFSCNELWRGIKKKFEYFFSSILTQIVSEHEIPTEIIVEPSYDGETKLAIISNGQSFFFSCKAWDFWFEPKELLPWLEQTLLKMEEALL